MDVALMTGHPRSGTTLLGRLLGTVPGFVFVGELVHVWQRGFLDNELCSCGVEFRSCPFWSDVIRELGGLEDGSSGMAEASGKWQRLPRPSDLTGDQVRPPDTVTHVARLYRAVADVSGARVIVDASKAPRYAFHLRQVPSLRLSAIQVIRDPRAVAYSQGKVRRRPEVYWTRSEMWRRPPLQSALEWSLNNLMSHWLIRSVGRGKRVRYEDMVWDWPKTVADLAEWICPTALASERAALDPDVAELPPVHTIAGNPMRFATGAVRIALDDEWRTGLRRLDRNLVSLITFPLMWKYGYVRGSDEARALKSVTGVETRTGNKADGA